VAKHRNGLYAPSRPGRIKIKNPNNSPRRNIKSWNCGRPCRPSDTISPSRIQLAARKDPATSDARFRNDAIRVSIPGHKIAFTVVEVRERAEAVEFSSNLFGT